MCLDESSADQRVMAISWERHRRFASLCTELGISANMMESRKSAIVRYVTLSLRTIWMIAFSRPRVLLVQNPSLVLSVLMGALRRTVWGGRLVVDAHNEAIRPVVHTGRLIRMLARLAIRWADTTIVTNDELASVVSALGGRPLVLPDALPEIALAPPRDHDTTEYRVLVICTYSADEPIEQILIAARSVGKSCRFYFTGRAEKLHPELRPLVGSNVVLTGFLSEEAYWETMRECDVVLDLTTMPDCLVCGSYEALALGRPMILTDSPASRRLFADVAVHCGTDAAAIAHGVMEARRRHPELAARIAQRRFDFQEAWKAASLPLRKIFGLSA